MPVTESLQDVLRTLTTTFGPRLEAVVLFGSRARGDAREDSDWDLLVLLHDLPFSPLQRTRLILENLPLNWRYNIHPLVLTPSEWFRRVPPIALDVALDGIVLYDAHGRVRRGLHTLREQIQRQGLARERTGEEWLWIWKEPQPAPTWSWG